MSSGTTIEKSNSFLKAVFSHLKPRTPSLSRTPRPVSSHTPTCNAPTTNLTSNITSGSPSAAGASTNNGITAISNSGKLCGPAHPAGNSFLNCQPPTISAPAKNEAFEKALQVHIDKLEEDDKAAFQSATDVMEKLAEFQQDKSRISASHTNCVERVKKVLQCMSQFLGSVTICIQHSPQISSLVVGGLHCILTVSIYLFKLSPTVNY